MSNHAPYFGPERRKEQRRKSADRRESIRFEPDKDLRRCSHGRRKKDAKDPWSRTSF
jgi:hypothetical protein